jgi:hypothetical protein
MKLKVLFVLVFLVNYFNAFSQCDDCDVTINGNGNPSGNFSHGSKVCISGNRTNAINFNNRNNIIICIADGASWNGQASSLSGLSQINNYGTLSMGTDFNGNWTVNNYGTFNFSTNINSSKSINNFSTMNVPGSISVNGILNSQGQLNIGGSATFNSSSNVTIVDEMNVGGAMMNNTTINLAGSINVNGSMTNNGNGRIEALNANQCNSINVSGAFASDGIITGNDLDYNSTGTALVVNKMPGGNANPRLRGGARVGACSGENCLEVVEVLDSGNLMRYYIFRCDGILNVAEPVIEEDYEEVLLSATALLVAGGGGGGKGLSAGGGGAGGVLEIEDIPIEPNTEYFVIVGKGGIGSGNEDIQGSNGTNSSILSNTAIGGGGGGSSSENAKNGRSGGSGGGGAFDNNGIGGSQNGIVAQMARNGGNAGRRGNSNVRAGGGGGGAGANGGIGQVSTGFVPGDGGNGVSIDFIEPIAPDNLINAFSGGGGATSRNSGGQSRFSEGGTFSNLTLGGDGNDEGTGKNGSPNTGSGGGAGSQRGGSGSNGIVVVMVTYRILPVEYLYFEGALSQDQKTVGLSWATAKEWESSHFEVLRSFDNIDSWEKVGEVEAAGYSESPKEYSFEDNDNFTPFNMAYYQLRQVDFDESSHLSKVIGIQLPVNSDQTVTWRVYPNPASNQNVQLSILEQGGHSGETVYATLFYPLGRSIQFTGNTISELSEQLNDALKNGGRGVYILNLLWGNENQQLKVLKN